MSGKDGSRIRWERSARACAVAAMLIALPALARSLAAPVLPSFLQPPQTTMRPTTVATVLCLAASLILATRRRISATAASQKRYSRARRWGVGLTVLAMVIGLGSLVQSILHTVVRLRSGSFERILDAQQWIGGRMSLLAGAQTVLLGLALLGLWSQRHRIRQAAALTAAVLALIVITGYAYGGHDVRAGVFHRIALSTAVCQALIAAGALVVRPNRGVTAILISSSAGGIIARRLVPTAILVPLLLGWIQTLGQNHGWYDPGLGEAMMAVSTVLILLVVTWLAARALRRLDAERRHAQASVGISEERFRATFEQAAVGVAHVSTARRYIRVNQKFCDITGYSRQELLWLTFNDITHPDDLDADVANFRRALAGELDTFSTEKRYVRKDGSPIWVQLTVSLVRRPRDGRPDYFIAVTEDISARKHIQEDRDGLLVREQAARAQAEAASRAKDQLLAVVSHELRTPLTPVLLMVSAMQRDAEVPEHVRADLALVQEQVQREAGLIEDLLDVTRAARGKLALRPEPIDVHALLGEVARGFAFDVQTKRQVLSLELTADPCTLEADPTRLRQVFGNLLHNAIKFTPDGGRIAVYTRVRDSNWFVVRLTDSGIGIAADAIGRLFEPFEQAERTVTRQFGGLGLGLSICKSLVQVHGGTIRAESAGHGRGATFTVELPLAPSRAVIVESSPSLQPSPELRPEVSDGYAASPPAASPRLAPAARPAAASMRPHQPVAGTNGASSGPLSDHGNGAARAANPLRILIVEDNPATLHVLARLVRAWGHDVVTASTASTAMEIALNVVTEAHADEGDAPHDLCAAAAPIDLLLCDIGLPDMSGWELMRQLRTRRPDLSGVALSGFASDDDARRSKEAGFLGHMSKPVDLHKLESLLRGMAQELVSTTPDPRPRAPRHTTPAPPSASPARAAGR